MTAYNDTFQRKEIKYRLDARCFEAMLGCVEARLEPDAFSRTSVFSVYFDTPQRDLIAHSLEKPLYKEKLRMRSYGLPDEGTRVFVEIKKKFKGVVYKRRVALSYAAARAFLGGMPYTRATSTYPIETVDAESEGTCSHEPSVNRSELQIAEEISAFMQRYETLTPSMGITCDRLAFAGDDLRITFDQNIRYVDYHSMKSLPHELMAPGYVIMEVKSTGPYPEWLTQLLSSMQVYPSSFSKYGEAYRACEATAPQRKAYRPACTRRNGVAPSNSAQHLASSPKHAQSACKALMG